MANRKLRRGVVKQLSNISIDEVSTVDRGANQHALISIAKRAPEADDYFEEVEKFDIYNSAEGRHYRKTTPLGQRMKDAFAPSGHQQRKQNARDTYAGHPKTAGVLGLPTGHGFKPTAAVEGARVAGAFGGAAVGGAAGHKVGGAEGAVLGSTLGAVAGGATAGAKAGTVIHHHYNFGKRAEDDKPMDVDALFDVSKKKSSFGQGGNQAVLDEFSGDDPSGVLADPNGEEGDVGPDGTIDGVETIEGEDTPPQKKKKKSSGSDINPSDKAGLGKSADFWKNVVSKILDDDEFETEDNDDENVGKHFPGPPGAGGFGAQPPQPTMGGQMGMPPQAQSVGASPMGMGQPMPPAGGGMAQQGGMAQGGMPAQLPPDVVQYIQQLEQALDQLTGGTDTGDNGDQSSSSSSGSNSDDEKKNPFGKSLEHSDMDEATFLMDLSKALDDDEDREVVNKALETVQKAEHRAKQAEEIAKAERDLRLEREFIAKAAEFNLPIKSADLGPVLKRAAEALDTDDFQVIVKCLRSSSAANEYSPYGEVGKRGGGDNADILTEVESKARELVGKSAQLTPEVATLQVLNENPAAYDEYLRDRRTRLQ